MASIGPTAPLAPPLPVDPTSGASSVRSAPFGTLPDGTPATLYTLTSGSGSRVRLTDYGGTIVSVEVPDRDGRLGDVVLGFGSVEGYASDAALEANPYFGALIGRYGNRIARSRFPLDGETVVLAANEGPNHLHGGPAGFDKRMWSAEPFQRQGAVGLRLSRVSPDGEEGYPGTLRVAVTVTFTGDDRLVLDYRATTDAPTVVNLTQHSYFNLTGDPSVPVGGHHVQVRADAFLPIDDACIPTGETCAVEGTPFDLRQPTLLSSRLDAGDAQIQLVRGFDHTFLLRSSPAGEPVEAARVSKPVSGRVLTVATTEPGVQLYTGNALDGRLRGKGGTPYGRWAGLCLETQHPPDAPNQPGFPSTVLRPGETFASRTVYTFRAEAL